MADEGATAPDSGADDGAAAAAAATGAPAADAGELATLKQRNSGLNAKVSELQKQLEAERAARTTAESAVQSNEKADESLRKQIADLQAEAAKAKQEAALAAAGAKYPEAFALLGEGIAGMPTENLAALEARLTAKGDEGDDSTPPKPLGNNQQRTGSGAKALEDMTPAEVKATLLAMDPSVMFKQS